MNNALTFYEVIELQQMKINKYEERIKKLETVYIKLALLVALITLCYGFMIISLKSKIDEVRNDINISNNL